VRTWCDVARVATTKKLDGGLVVKRTAGFPFFLDDAMSIMQDANVVFYVAPPATDAPRELHLSCFAPDMTDDDSIYLHFAEVDSIDIAQKLVGSHLLVDTSALEDAGLCLSAAPALNSEGWANPQDWDVPDVAFNNNATDAIGVAFSSVSKDGQFMADMLFAVPPDAFIGYAFTDAVSGAHGVIVDAQSACDQLLFTVRIDDAEHLVPVVPDLIQSLNPGTHTISVECARGLFDL
jgi:hypothetical protein